MRKKLIKQGSVIDVFCGAGGLSHGFVKEGFPVIAGIDADPACKYAFEKNNNAIFINKPIEKIAANKISELYPENHIKILVGCAPCQPFSSYSQKSATGDKWKLLYGFSSLINKIRPDIISMENVTPLRKFSNGKVFRNFTRSLENIGYSVSSYDVFCPDFGIPQRRTRLVLFASLHGKIKLIPKTHHPGNYKTVRHAISGLEKINHGEVSKNDLLHRSSKLSNLNFKRIKSSIPGGTWRDWDKKLVAHCHKKKTGKTYPSVYGRMEWDAPSPTITTQCYGFGNGRFGHPEQNRAISLREAALLQTFPAKYEFIAPNDPLYTKVTGRLIGNAVPVQLGKVIAKSISNHMEVIRGN